MGAFKEMAIEMEEKIEETKKCLSSTCKCNGKCIICLCEKFEE